MSDKVRGIMQVINSRGQQAVIVVERDLASGVITLTSTEVSDMRVYTERSTLSETDYEETRSPWVTDFNEAKVPSNV
jgi:hypothetical protein